VQDRRLNLLRQIALAGGTATPAADPEAEAGYSYAAIGDDIARDLEALARRNYLETRFLDRVSLCPKCNSHHLNIREICPGCRRAHLVTETLLHHFRCGYVGIPAEFAQTKDGGYICPKCNGRMHHLGTEYDRLGRAFRCRTCAVISENPPAEAVCLSCGNKTPAESLISRDVHSYVLTSHGAAAIRQGALLDDEDDVISVPDSPVYGRTVTLEFVDHYVKCLQTFESTFSVLTVDCHLLPEDQTEENSIPLWLTRLREALRDVDVIGQLADTRYIVLLPQTRKRAAETVRQNAVTALGPQSPFSLTVVEITKPAQLTQIVAGRNTLARSA
jgi:Zn finger protein HypA/HybF involved in hydrogenase expression